MPRAYSEHGGLLERIQQQPVRPRPPRREPRPRPRVLRVTGNGLAVLAIVAMVGAFLVSRAVLLSSPGAAPASPPVTVTASPPPRCSTSPALHQQLPPCTYTR